VSGGPACGPGCSCPGNEFGERDARRDLAGYRKNGPERTTRRLIDGLAAGGVEGMSVLDIGAGVGAVHLELLGAGATSAVDVDGSAAYVEASRDEATRRGIADRVVYSVGDFVAFADEVAPADLVALDKVVCCYPDLAALVRLSAARARRRYGLVYPRDTWWIRVGGRLMNGVFRLTRQRLRFYIHPTATVDAIVRAAGFGPAAVQAGLFWQVAVYERA
jgi:magnesium-protoporphyrin O-methyltransferase